MSEVAILNMGAMGSDLANTLVETRWGVSLWGMWLNDHLADTIKGDRPHPCINVVISGRIHPFRSADLEDTLDGASAVVVSVASQGIPKVAEMALPGTTEVKALWLTSEGFMPVDGKTLLPPDGARSIAKAADIELPPIVVIAGSVKINECVIGGSIATIFGCKSRDVAVESTRTARSEHYYIETADNEVGVKIRVPMKNVHTIMLDVADGLGEKTGRLHRDLKTTTFDEAMYGMSILSTALGVDPTATYGLPDVDNSEATGLSGHNKVYGVRIDRDKGTKGALQAMTELKQTVEGVPALLLAISLVKQSAPQIKDRLPLLYAARQIVEKDVPDYAVMFVRAVLPPRP